MHDQQQWILSGGSDWAHEVHLAPGQKEDKTHWYFPAADAYNSTGPSYPRQLIYDAVNAAASSMHWITLEIGYSKASSALKANGHLILLWNKEPQPRETLKDALPQLQQLHIPSFVATEAKKA